MLDKNYYSVEETYPFLNKIYNNLDEYKKEIINISGWINWVEKDLYKNGDWTIIPFFGFDIWAEDNCKKCPKLANFIKNIPGLKTAILSKMTPGTKLSEHRGWAKLSNNVLRCHFNFIIPNDCYISVGDFEKNKPQIPENIKREIKQYKQDEWLIFDDSKFHYTWNDGKFDRVVLILDINRPKNIKKGNAIKGDTKELVQLLDSFKNKIPKDI